MRIVIPTLSRLGGLAVAGAMMAACLAAPTPVLAQTGTNIRVLVMGEDSDPNTVRRTSDIFKRVMAELKGSMQRYGFRMVDEEMLAVDLGWIITERRPKTELIAAMKLANTSRDATHHVRAMTLFRIHAYKQDLGFSSKVETRIDGEMYDALTNQFLGTFEIPRASYPAPAQCEGPCISEIVGDHAREIATTLGDVLGKKLVLQSPGPGGSVGSGPVTGGGGTAGPGLMTTYTLTMRHFPTSETMQIIGVMTSEFPGYSSHNAMETSGAVQRYEYVTTATQAKLVEWIKILLSDMSLNLDRDVELRSAGTQITIDRLLVGRTDVPPPRGPRFQ